LFDIVAKNGNNVESTVDFVDATFDFVERIARLVFHNVVSMVPAAGVDAALREMDIAENNLANRIRT